MNIYYTLNSCKGKQMIKIVKPLLSKPSFIITLILALIMILIVGRVLFFDGDDADKNQEIPKEEKVTLESRESHPNSRDTTVDVVPYIKALTLEIEKKELNKNTSVRYSLTALYSDGTTKIPKSDEVVWNIEPKKSLQVSNTTLIAKQEGEVILNAEFQGKTSKARQLNIYWELNGHKLPPKPDQKVNDSTLLGIDSNDNGIRDDVERYVIIRYAQYREFPKTKTAIALQYAWSSQKILENPTMESSDIEDDALACQFYWVEKQTKEMSGFETMQYYSKHEVFGDAKIKDKIYNTRERINTKFSYNAALGGHILEDKKDETIDRCRTNIDELGE